METNRSMTNINPYLKPTVPLPPQKCSAYINKQSLQYFAPNNIELSIFDNTF